MRDRGLLYYQLGNWTAATEDLETYLAKVPSAKDAPAIRRLLNSLK